MKRGKTIFISEIKPDGVYQISAHNRLGGFGRISGRLDGKSAIKRITELLSIRPSKRPYIYPRIQRWQQEEQPIPFKD